MKVTNADIWQAARSIGELCNQPWVVKTAFALTRLSRKLREHYQDIEQVRVDLITRYGKPNERGVPEVKPDNPDFPAFADAWNELLGQETEIEAEPVNLGPGCGDLQVKPDVLLAMGPFVTFEESAA